MKEILNILKYEGHSEKILEIKYNRDGSKFITCLLIFY